MILAVRDACDLHEHVKRTDPAPEIDDLVDALAAADSTNARITLLATAFNNLAIAIIVAAFILPAISGIFAAATAWTAIKTVVWSGFGTALNGTAQLVFGKLKPS